ncbi:hypothetical protein Peur_062933 [Populus x canadensis]
MSKEGRWCTRLNGIEGVLFLCKRFTVADIQHALHQKHPTKAPSQDRMAALSYQEVLAITDAQHAFDFLNGERTRA